MITIDEFRAEDTSGPFALLFNKLKAMRSPDNKDAWDLMRFRAGASRDLRSMLAGGTIALAVSPGSTRQSIDPGQPLVLRWTGGQPPFHIRLVEPDGISDVVVTDTPTRTTRLDLASLVPGDYLLALTGRAGTPLALPVHVVPSKQVPIAPEAKIFHEPHARALVQAVWLLTQAGPVWRLDAQSRLYGLAEEGDEIAQSIVGMQASGSRNR